MDGGVIQAPSGEAVAMGAGATATSTATAAVAAGAAARAKRDARRAELGDRIAEQAYHLDAAMHRLLADLRAFDEAGYWADEGAVSCAAWLSWRVGWTPGTGREHVRVARALGTLPMIDAALRDGRLSYSKVRAITRVATPATEPALLNAAIHTTAAQLEIICRKFATVQRLQRQSPDHVRARRTVRRRERDDGMVVIEAVLPADEAALVYAAIEAAAARLSQDRVPAEAPPPAADAAIHPDDAETAPASTATKRADSLTNAADTATPGLDGTANRAVPTGAATGWVPAGTPTARGVPGETPPAIRLDRADGLVAMAQEALRGRALDRSPVEVVLTISHAALHGAAQPSPLAVGTFGDGTCVSAETARRHACDAAIVGLHEDAAGQPLSVGRRTRSVPAAIARALARRDATCRFPGCTHRRFLDAHHLVHWLHGGETSLDNLVRLCGHHHRFLHEHGYRAALVDGELIVTDPRGRRVHAEPPRTARAPLGGPAVRAAAAAAGITIDPQTGRSRWNGRPVDHEWVVHDLVRHEVRHEARHEQARLD